MCCGRGAKVACSVVESTRRKDEWILGRMSLIMPEESGGWGVPLGVEKGCWVKVNSRPKHVLGEIKAGERLTGVVCTENKGTHLSTHYDHI